MDALRETALLGTEKKALDIQHLPEAIKILLKDDHAPDPEWQFLEACAYYTFYDAIGKLPSKFTGTIDDAILKEDREIAPQKLMDIAQKMDMIDHQLRDSALNLWLDVLIENKWIAGPDRLVDLIYGNANASNHTKAKIISVIGNKGRWILQNDTSVTYSVAPSGSHVWTEGTTNERKNILIAQRQRDPQAAIALLRSTWETESVVNKKMFLELIQRTNSPSDTPFMEELYNGEFKQQPKEKKTEKECRRIVAAVLLNDPSSTLYQTATKNLLRYIVKGKKGIVGFVTGQAGNTFRLPDAEDDFWNAKTMDEVFGFESKGYDIAIYSSVISFWLAYFIEYLPFTFWVRAFENDDKKAVQFWLLEKTVIAGKSVPVYLQPLLDNAVSHRDKELASALMQSQDPHMMLAVLSVVDPATFESFIIKNDYETDVELLAHGPFTSETSWSASFSEKIIESAYKLAEQNQLPQALGKLIARFAHITALDVLYRINNKAKDTAAYHQWNTAVFQIAQPLLELRNTIHALKK